MYNEWITHLFDHPESEGDWRFKVEPLFSNQEEIAELARLTFDSSEESLNQFTNWQLNAGLYFFFSNNCSDYSFALRDHPTPLELRLKAISSIKNLYANCFNKRCEPALLHLNKKGNELNEICYMLWDITPLLYCENNIDKNAIHKGLLDVLEFALLLSNPACVESALHGLGHMKLYCPEITPIINKHLRHIKTVDAKLYDYALLAREGRIL